MTSPVPCALPRRNVGIASRKSASTRRTSYTLTWPNLSWLRRKGEAAVGGPAQVYKIMGRKKCSYFCSRRELEEYKEKQDDNQNGGDAAKISSKHVCVFLFVLCLVSRDNNGIFVTLSLWKCVGEVSKGHGRTVFTSGWEEKSEFWYVYTSGKWLSSLLHIFPLCT